MKENIVKTVVAVAAGNEVTDNGVITALGLEQSVLLGMTFGAWFKVGMFIALILLIGERASNIIMTWKRGKKNGGECNK